MLDTYDDYSPINPINMEDLLELNELEQLQEDYSELRDKVRKAKKQIAYLKDLSIDSQNGLLLRYLEQIQL